MTTACTSAWGCEVRVITNLLGNTPLFLNLANKIDRVFRYLYPELSFLCDVYPAGLPLGSPCMKADHVRAHGLHAFGLQASAHDTAAHAESSAEMDGPGCSSKPWRYEFDNAHDPMHLEQGLSNVHDVVYCGM